MTFVEYFDKVFERLTELGMGEHVNFDQPPTITLATFLQKMIKTGYDHGVSINTIADVTFDLYKGVASIIRNKQKGH